MQWDLGRRRLARGFGQKKVQWDLGRRRLARKFGQKKVKWNLGRRRHFRSEKVRNARLSYETEQRLLVMREGNTKKKIPQTHILFIFYFSFFFNQKATRK